MEDIMGDLRNIAKYDAAVVQLNAFVPNANTMLCEIS